MNAQEIMQHRKSAKIDIFFTTISIQRHDQIQDNKRDGNGGCRGDMCPL